MAWLNGERTLAEQMIGLDDALNRAGGRTVLDLGCAEGLIALEFAKRGAKIVHGVDVSPEMIKAARHESYKAGLDVRFEQVNLNEALPEWMLPEYDIVLALAVIHKLNKPALGARMAAKRTRRRLVIRLPFGSAGIFAGKHAKTEYCNLFEVLPEYGLRLDNQCDGPRGEFVQHWVRHGV